MEEKEENSNKQQAVLIPKLSDKFKEISIFFNEMLEYCRSKDIRIVVDFYNFDQNLIDLFLLEIKDYYTFVKGHPDFKKYIFHPIPLFIDL